MTAPSSLPGSPEPAPEHHPPAEGGDVQREDSLAQVVREVVSALAEEAGYAAVVGMSPAEIHKATESVDAALDALVAERESLREQLSRQTEDAQRYLSERDTLRETLIQCAEMAGEDGEAIEAARSGAMTYPSVQQFAFEAVVRLRNDCDDRSDLDEAVRRAEQFEERERASAKRAEQAEAAISSALNELGVPQPGYPAPVANAVEILSAALAGVPTARDSKEGDGA